ncbi:MAG: hypothetical protein FJ246_04450 [Nitrospira sp.]|nr:hypothetical protein [Nitrospira sp.]
MYRAGFVLLSAWFLVAPVAAAPQEAALSSVRHPDRSPGFNDKFDDKFEVAQEEELERLCAFKAIRTVPLLSIHTAGLSVHQVTLHIEAGYYTAQVPLLHSQGAMTALYWSTRSLDEARQFIRLLQSGTVKVLRVEPHTPEFRPDAQPKLSDEELRSCSAPRIQSMLMKCAECRIRELVFDGPMP